LLFGWYGGSWANELEQANESHCSVDKHLERKFNVVGNLSLELLEYKFLFMFPWIEIWNMQVSREVKAERGVAPHCVVIRTSSLQIGGLFRQAPLQL
jgi:hypothetical protein